MVTSYVAASPFRLYSTRGKSSFTATPLNRENWKCCKRKRWSVILAEQPDAEVNARDEAKQNSPRKEKSPADQLETEKNAAGESKDSNGPQATENTTLDKESELNAASGDSVIPSKSPRAKIEQQEESKTPIVAKVPREPDTPQMSDTGQSTGTGTKRPSSADIPDEEMVQNGPVTRQTTNKDSGKTTQPLINQPSVPKQKQEQNQGTKTKGTSRVRMSPEQIEKAQREKQKRDALELEKAKEDAEKRKKLLDQATNVLKRAGERSQALRLGAEARTKIETFLSDAIAKKDDKDTKTAGKLGGTAADLIRKSSASLSTKFDKVLVPEIRKKLPQGFHTISKTAIASGIMALFLSVALFPTFFVGKAPQSLEKKKINSETAYLEKKLRDPSQKSKSTPKVSSEAKTPDSIFPQPENEDTPRAKYSRKAPTRKKLPLKQLSPEDTTKVASGEKDSSLTTKALKTSEKQPQDTQPSQPPPKVDRPIQGRSGPSLSIAAATAALKSAVGNQQNIISGTELDSLASDPTIIITVGPDFRKLSISDQKKFTETATQSARASNFDGVAVVDTSGTTLASGGTTITIGDEVRSLRAKVEALRKETSAIAAERADQVSEIESLSSQLRSNDEEVSKLRKEYEDTLKSVRTENRKLGDDLVEAEKEIANIPDAQALLARTEAAESDSLKMSGTVEMLSRQVTVARDAQAASEKNRIESEQKAALAVKREKDLSRNMAQEAEKKIALAEEAARSEKELREKAETAAEKDKGKAIQDVTRTFQQRLAEVQRKSENELDKAGKEYANMESELKSRIASMEKDANRLSQELEANQKQRKTERDSWESERLQLGEKVKLLESKVAERSLAASQQ